MRLMVRSLALLSGLSRELWYRSQMQLRSGVAVAVAWVSSYRSDSTPSLGTSIYHGCGPKKEKEKSTPLMFVYLKVGLQYQSLPLL